MNRKQLEKLIFASCGAAGDSEVYVIGSQSILGACPSAPEDLLKSMEMDAFPKNNTEGAAQIEAFLGEESDFHRNNGIYVQSVDRSTAVLADGWESRCVEVKVARDKTGWCLEPHDLALAKLAAFREKDRDFVRTMLLRSVVQKKHLIERLECLPVDEEAKSRIAAWVSKTHEEMKARSRARMNQSSRDD